MRIKTITCHDVYNVGASLQAYALAAYLRELGHEVEIIDYKPDYLSNHYRLFGLNNPAYDKPFLREAYQIAKFPERLRARFSKRKKEYDRFTRKLLPITEVRYTSNEELKCHPPVADVYFAGSDQIWNTLFKNGRDPAFYLDFVPEGRIKAVYAASFATEEIESGWEPQIRKWLSALDYISVRESSGVKLAEKMGASGIVQVLDPVFLLGADQWRSIEKDMRLNEPYLLLYDFDRNPVLSEFAKDIAKKNSWKIYSILSNDCCDRCFVQEGPQAFVSLVYHAEFVVSNSFHATAFSLIFHKQFVVFERKEGINTRMRDMVDLAGISDRLFGAGRNEKLCNIDYGEVQRKLDVVIKQSKEYIDRVLEAAE